MLDCSRLIGAALLSLTLVACAKEPAVEYRLSAAQLAWQGYRAGQELRFGHARDGRVRTYRVVDVQDRLEKQFMGYGVALPFPRKAAPLYQQITVRVQRTDTAAQQVLTLGLRYDPIYDLAPQLEAEAEWESFYYARLPIEAVNAGAPIDTLQYAARLLPAATLGPATYTQVIRVDNRPYAGAAPLGRQTRRLYYAKGLGVVAFEEAGNDLWYRLP